MNFLVFFSKQPFYVRWCIFLQSTFLLQDRKVVPQQHFLAGLLCRRENCRRTDRPNCSVPPIRTVRSVQWVYRWVEGRKEFATFTLVCGPPKRGRRFLFRFERRPCIAGPPQTDHDTRAILLTKLRRLQLITGRCR